MADNRIFRPRLFTPHRIWKVKQAWRTNKSIRLLALIIVLILVGISIGALFPSDPQTVVVEKQVDREVLAPLQEAPTKFYRITAEGGVLVGRYGNALDLKGEYSQQLTDATASVSVEPDAEFGVVEVELPKVSFNPEDQARIEGNIKIVVNRFRSVESWQREGIVLDEMIFGDTGKGFDLLPTTHVLLAAYGEADVLLDDQELYGNLKAMVLYTDGLRDEAGQVAKDGELYATKHNSQAFTEGNDRELHIFVYRDLEDKKNFPTKDVWIEVYFEEPQIVGLPPGAKD